MKLNNLSKQKGRKHKHRRGKGPGSGSGKTAGRGHKGGFARSGYTLSPSFEGGQTPLARKVPARGFSNYKFEQVIHIINVGQLEKLSVATVDRSALIAAGLMRESDKKVKILGNGELSKALTVSADAFSKSAEEKIKAAGGSIQIVTTTAPVTK